MDTESRIKYVNKFIEDTIMSRDYESFKQVYWHLNHADGVLSSLKNENKAKKDFKSRIIDAEYHVNEARDELDMVRSNTEIVEQVFVAYFEAYKSLKGNIDFMEFLIYMVETDKLSTEAML